MKVTLAACIFTLNLGIILSHGHGGRQRSGKMCLSSSEVSLACTKGTPLGEKLTIALKTCTTEKPTEMDNNPSGKSGYNPGQPQFGRTKDFGRDQHFGRWRNTRSARRGFGGRGWGNRQCPTVDDLIQKFEMKVSQERCLMRELGWANGTDQENLAIMSVDLSSLPGNAATEIFSTATDCSGMIVEKYQQKMKRCTSTYDPEATATINTAINSTVSTICFSKSFNDACGKIVKDSLLNTDGQASRSLINTFPFNQPT